MSHKNMSSTSQPAESFPVQEHVRRLGRFFSRFAVPAEPISLVAWLTQQVKALLELHATGDEGAIAVLELAPHPIARPSAEDARSMKLSRAMAEEIIAATYRFSSWQAVASAKGRVVEPLFEQAVEAIVNGRLTELQQLLTDNSSLTEAHSAFGHETFLLHYVSANGVEDHRQKSPPNIAAIAKLLLEFGANPDALSQSYGGGPNETPLCLTVSSYHPHAAGVQSDLVRVLVDGGAKANGLEDDAMPLATALSFGYPATAHTLVELGARVDNVVLAAGLGEVGRLQGFFSNGSLVNHHAYHDPFGKVISEPQQLLDRALFVACKSGHAEAAELLLSHGADVNVAPQRSETALHWAVYHGHEQVVEVLLAHGANATLQDEQWHCTPAAWAAEGGNKQLAEQLQARLQT